MESSQTGVSSANEENNAIIIRLFIMSKYNILSIFKRFFFKTLYFLYQKQEFEPTHSYIDMVKGTYTEP